MGVLFEKITEKKSYWFDRVVLLISIISGILTIIDFLLKENDMIKNSTIGMGIIKHKTLLIIVSAFSWMLAFLFLALKYRSSTIRRMRASSNGIKKLMEMTINTMKELDGKIIVLKGTEVKKGKLYDCVLESCIKEYVRYTRDFLNVTSNIINNYIDIETGISLSYKMISEIFDNNKIQNSIDRYGTITIARSSNTSEKRKITKLEKPIPLSLNSDFLNIVDSNLNDTGLNYFYKSDLLTYKKEIQKLTDGGIKYMNSSCDWFENYNSTMVVPVGVFSNNGEFDIYGFLCADALSKKAFNERQKSINIRLFQGIASIYSLVALKYNECEKVIFGD